MKTKLLKQLILFLAVSKHRYYALPNQYFKSHVCPELVGRFSLQEAKKAINELQMPANVAVIQTQYTALTTSLTSPLDDIIQSILNTN